MGWVSGTPNVPVHGSGSPVDEPTSTVGSRIGDLSPPWVPPNPAMNASSVGQARMATVLFLGNGVAYLLAVMCILFGAALHGLLSGGGDLAAPWDGLQERLATLGWLGLTTAGILMFLVPMRLGVPYRPFWVAEVHLVLVNVGLIGYGVAVAGWGVGIASSGFLLLAALSYIMFSIPLMYALLLAFQDWMSGGI
jgi:hypothetical protein